MWTNRILAGVRIVFIFLLVLFAVMFVLVMGQ